MDFPMLRLQNIFQGLAGQGTDNPNAILNQSPSISPSMPPGNQGSQGLDYTPVPNTQPQGNDIQSLMSQMYTPENTMQNKFQGMLDSYPTQDHPSVLRRIGAILAGLGAQDPYQASFRAAHAPLLKAQENWQTLMKPTETAASDERMRNTNERMLIQNIATSTLNQRKVEETERANKAKEEENSKRTKIQQQRADLLEYEKNHPDLKFGYPKGGFITVENPKTGEVHKALDSDGNPIPTGTLSDEERIQREAANAQKLQGMREIGLNNRANQAQEGMNQRLENAGNKIVQAYDPVTGKPLAPQVVNPRKKGLLGLNGVLARPSSVGVGTTSVTTTEVPPSGLRSLGMQLGIASAPEPKKSVTVKTPNSGGIVSTKVKMQDPNGKMYLLDSSQADEAVKHGWKKVG